MQFKAGYIADSVANIINEFKANLDKNIIVENKRLLQINGLLQNVSSFDVDFPFEHNPDLHNLNPVLSTINNIITRGLPTRLPVSIETLFSEIGLTEPNKEEFEFNFLNSTKNIDFETLFNLLHIVEPKLEIDRNQYGGFPGSLSEWNFLDNDLKEFPYAKQILQSQRDFSTIGDGLTGGRTVDFSYEFPYLTPINLGGLNDKQRQGIIYEFDGPDHKLQTIKIYDKYRDDVADAADFETLRQSFDEIGLNPSIENQFKSEIFNIFKTNYQRETKDFLPEYSLIFIPLGVARIKKTIIEFLISNPNEFEKEEIKIAIIERDLPCGAIAIKSLKDFFENINALLEEKDKLLLPKICLTIFENEEWVIDSRLHLDASLKNEEFFKLTNFDIIIDHSILRRSNIYKEIDFISDNAIKIRSSHYFDTKNGRKIYCADLLDYKSLVEKKDDGSYIPINKYENHINFFIQNIFRKVSFRDGQLPIISRALQQKPVIGLLPTGGGKSLTFQLPTFLQPGLCLVVDPIKSLMEDQVRVLKQNWIDCCDFINSNLSREEKLKKLIDFRFGETMFFFVSPERFVMEDFRNIINEIDVSRFGLGFSYCVIDEVHCVSEWGHDFRSTYLMLGKNAQKYSKTKSEKPVSLIGLTATASFDVLADIERELQIKHNDVADAIIMIENTIRPELFFRIIDVTGKDRIEALNEDFQNIGRNLSKINNQEILLRSQKHHFNEFGKKDFASATTKDLLDESKMEFDYNPRYLINDPLEELSQDDFYSIIFCAVKGEKMTTDGEWANKNGVRYVHSKLSSTSRGFFFASDDGAVGDEVQEHFEKFTTDKIKHIVCTKAFGMGIDKKDIRTTYHYVYSGSLESLVQEAGRSGRDKKISEANILISTKKYVKFDIYSFFDKYYDNDLIRNPTRRRFLRKKLEQKWNHTINKFEKITFPSIEKLLDEVEMLMPELKAILLEKDNDNNYSFITEKYADRDIHDFFHNMSFKGVDTEKSQLLNLFRIKEFEINNGIETDISEQDTLVNEFEKCETNQFKFIITASKRYPKASNKICKLLNLDPTEANKKLVQSAYKYSHDFQDFLFQLEEKDVIDLKLINQITRDRLLFVYSCDRKSAIETGRLIYRMHSMGFLEDYLIDYRNGNLFICTFNKHPSIQDYVEEIEKYLKRYLSEQTVIEKIKKLNERLSQSSLIEKILECLNFLAEFSYDEIANKRTRATDEIESILNKSVTDEAYTKNWYDQNIYIKEQIYFYFNAKYARIGFKINGKAFSLLDDYKEKSLNKAEILNKYLNVYKFDEGTDQNNYKHMMGSCKKILRSLSETDLNNEWLLRLLKAFSMYSVNNPSYISEANTELELGFINLYKDENFHKNDFEMIKPIYKSYFQILEKNIQEDNESFKDIKLISAKILIKMQTFTLDSLILKNNKLKAEIYA